MLPMLVFLAVVAGLVLRGMGPEERIRFVKMLLAALRFARDAVTKPPAGCEQFLAALSARTRWALVAPALAVLYVSVFVVMLLEGADPGDPQSLVEWGASIGPRTTNGEWWRLATATIVHLSVLHLFSSVAGLLQTGMLVERLVGGFAFASVYAASAILATLWTMSAHPVSISAGPAGAVFGVYGLLLAWVAWGMVHRSDLTIPIPVLKGLWPGAALFLAYHLVTEEFVSEAMIAGVTAGFVSGMVLLAGRVASPVPAVRRVCATLAVCLVFVAITAAPLRGLADMTGEVARVIEIEERTLGVYDEEVDKFRKGRLKIDRLIELADATATELDVLAGRIAAIDNVPIEHQTMLADASDYLRLRRESWRLKSEGLRTGRMQILQEGDRAEQAAVAALRRAASAAGR